MKPRPNKFLWLVITEMALLTIVLFLSTLNIKSSHNWGDDFAQYILQAKNIIEHRPQLATGVIQNEFSRARQIPNAAPVGFPLLLSPIYALFGNSIFHFGQLIALFFFLLLVTVFFYIYQAYGRWPAVALTLLVACNPWLLQFKSSILTDIPFTFFVILTIGLLIHFRHPRWKHVIGIGLAAGAAMSIRPAGMPLLVAILAYATWKTWHYHYGWKKILPANFTIVAVALAFSFLLNSVIFQTGIGRSYYTEATSRVTGKQSWSVATSQSRLSQYFTSAMNQLQVMTEVVPETPWTSVNTLLRSTFLITIMFGFLISARRPRLTEFFVVSYILMLILLRIGAGQGFRYLLPTLPFLLEYQFVTIVALGRRLDRFWYSRQAARKISVG